MRIDLELRNKMSLFLFFFWFGLFDFYIDFYKDLLSDFF